MVTPNGEVGGPTTATRGNSPSTTVDRPVAIFWPARSLPEWSLEFAVASERRCFPLHCRWHSQADPAVLVPLATDRAGRGQETEPTGFDEDGSSRRAIRAVPLRFSLASTSRPRYGPEQFHGAA